MKTLVLSMISIAATIAAMTACTSEGDPIDNIDNGQPVEIQLNAGVVTTKAAITSDTDGKLSADLANVHFYRIDGATPDWAATTPTTFTGKILAANKKISITDKQYYPVNGDKTTIAGLFVGDGATTPTLTSGVADVTITGKEDIISAIPVDLGNRETPNTTPLAFNHLLTQFQFVVKTDNSTVQEAINNININVKSANKSAKVTLSTGTIAGWSNSGSITGPTGLTAAADGTVSIASDGIMLEPNLASITLVITSDNLPNGGLEVTINGTDGTDGSKMFQQGYAYKVTLTFKAKEVEGTAIVAQWKPGTDAEGDVI